jgi:toxin-antitoxin system PIN domain toxin
VIIPDVNLLLYAYDTSSPFHSKAAAWWTECLSGSEPIGLPAVVAFAFVRLATHPRVFTAPLTPREAADHVRSWLAQPCLHILQANPNHVIDVLKLIEEIGAAGNLVTDAQLAALAIQNEAVLHTSDSDVLRFDGLRWMNPISGQRSRAT